MSVITLLTDFGLKDIYVGVMKGVISSINPRATIIDISHDIEAQDVEEAAFMVGEYYPWFPQGTVHVAVVDPTVGSSRRSLIAVYDGRYFVGPDNGIFTLVMGKDAEAYAIDNPEYMVHPVSATFHGRDVFSPAAAHLSLGVRPEDFGRRLDDPVLLEDLAPKQEGETLTGRIIRFDRFGNGITNIHRDALEPFVNGPFTIETGSLVLRTLSRTYYEREVACLIGSSGYLEFGYFKGNFSNIMNIKKGQAVRVRRS